MEGNEPVKRGEIYFADLGEDYVGSEQGRKRPVIIVQNDVGNQHSSTTIIVPCTSAQKSIMPTHCYVDVEFMNENTVALCEQIRSIDKQRLFRYVGELDDQKMKEIGKCIAIGVGLVESW